MDSSPPVVYLGCPSYGDVSTSTCGAIITASQHFFPILSFETASLLAHCFNKLWCAALNDRAEKKITHFAMIHADIAPEPWWLDTLLAEMERVDADVLSAVVAIKDTRGLTTTGWQEPATGRICRFTLKEVHAFPETFDAAGAGHPHDYLMVNTGLWIARLDRPWVDRFPGFNIVDAIKRDPAGKLVPQVLSEDWNVSGWWATNGVRVFATRKVVVSHLGRMSFQNNTPFGLAVDPGDGPLL